jgi:hypothetical protein
MNQLGDGLEAAGYSVGDVTKLRSPEVLSQIRQVLMGLAEIVQVAFKLACAKVFNPAEFIGEGWSVWKGPVDSNGLEGEEDRDIREDSLEAIDWNQVIMETNLQKGEAYITGEEKLLRLKAGKNIRLGAKAFLSLWKDYEANGANSMLEKLRKAKNMTRIYFFGTVLRHSGGNRYVLYLCFDVREWNWNYRWLDYYWNSVDPSASLASV